LNFTSYRFVVLLLRNRNHFETIRHSHFPYIFIHTALHSLAKA
jgi:hypothetical protein